MSIYGDLTDYTGDQWGVELGKGLAAVLQPQLESGDSHNRDASTARLIDYYQRVRTGAAALESAG